MKLISVPIAAAAALALSLPVTAFAQTSGTAGPSAQDTRTTKQLIDKANSIPVVADPKAPVTRKGIGSYPRRKGIILVTPDKFKGLIPTGHAAIVFEYGKVVESVREGVKWGPNNWNTSKTQAYGVTVRGTSTAQDAKAATWASHQRRKPYNFNYLNVNTRSSFYCSQLVWAAFKDNYGINLDTAAFGPAVHPMELVNNKKVSLMYRKK